jgi:copper chaperone
MTAFNVPDMTCGGCVKAITAAVQAVDAGAVVVANLDTKRVEVSGTATAAVLAEAMRDAGFTPATLAA